MGQLLRYTRMDELPQIINVARGEMRLIGTAGNRRVIATRSTVEIVARPELDGQ